MEKSNFDHLLKRYLTGQVSDPEKEKIEAWLEVMTTADPSDQALSKADEERLFQKIVAGNSSMDRIRTIIPSENRLTLAGWILRIAATLLIIACVAYAGWQTGRINDGRIAVASTGPVEKVKLTDGSLVWLKGNSELLYYRNQEEHVRYAALKGEALFEVAPDENLPFVVHCGQAMLKVVGTSFNVWTKGDSLELRVLTGKVNLTLGRNSEGVDIWPNERAVYIGTGDIKKLLLSTDEVIAVTSGTTYNMQFNNAALGQVLSRLQEKFGVRIRTEGGRVSACRITADLTDRSLENSLVVITEVLDVAYYRKSDMIVVTGAGCK